MAVEGEFARKNRTWTSRDGGKGLALDRGPKSFERRMVRRQTLEVKGGIAHNGQVRLTPPRQSCIKVGRGFGGKEGERHKMGLGESFGKLPPRTQEYEGRRQEMLM